MFYDRKIKYLDYYENGERIKGTGFIKLEARDGMVRLEVTVTGLHATDSFIRDVMICGPKQDSVVGRIRISGGKGQYRQLCQNLNDIEGTGISYGELRGIRIPLGGDRELSCIWQAQREPLRGSTGQEDIRGASERAGENSGGGWEKGNREADTGQSEPGSMGTGTLDRRREPADSGTRDFGKEPGGIRSEIQVQAGDVGESAAGNRGRMGYGQEAADRDQKLAGDGAEAAAGNRGRMGYGQEAASRDQKLAGDGAEAAAGSSGRKEDGYVSLTGSREVIAAGKEAVQEKSREMGDEVKISDKKRKGRGEAGRCGTAEASGMWDLGNGEAPGRGMQAPEKNGEAPGYGNSSGKNGEAPRRGMQAPGKNGEAPGYGNSSGKNGEVKDHGTESSSGKQETSGGEGRDGRGGTTKQPVTLLEDKWQQLCAIYPHINPFHDKREYLSIGPSDFVLFPSAAYKMVNNSFLLHGYYNYRHLILTRVERKGEAIYYIGVPGNYFEKEKQVAIMFGFESFECEEEPAQTGDFGYYMMRTEL